MAAPEDGTDRGCREAVEWANSTIFMGEPCSHGVRLDIEGVGVIRVSARICGMDRGLKKILDVAREKFGLRFLRLDCGTVEDAEEGRIFKFHMYLIERGSELSNGADDARTTTNALLWPLECMEPPLPGSGGPAPNDADVSVERDGYLWGKSNAAQVLVLVLHKIRLAQLQCDMPAFIDDVVASEQDGHSYETIHVQRVSYMTSTCMDEIVSLLRSEASFECEAIAYDTPTQLLRIRGMLTARDPAQKRALVAMDARPAKRRKIG